MYTYRQRIVLHTVNSLHVRKSHRKIENYFGMPFSFMLIQKMLVIFENLECHKNP